MTEEQAEKILKILEKGDRVELIPTKDGFKIMKIKRTTVN